MSSIKNFRMALALVAIAIAGLVGSATASAQSYVPRPHKACRAHYVRHVVRVRKRQHGHLVRRHGRVVWVRQVRCVYVAPKPAPKPTTTTPTTTTTTSPTIHYLAHTDPVLSRSPTNPLDVVYDYSADATATVGSTTTDLAAVGQLPSGILDFFNEGQLACSENVGGATTGGTCPITYGETGAHQVTTQYIPNGATAVTETDTETILPYPTTTTLTSSTDKAGHTLYNAAVTDGNGNPIQNALGDSWFTITDTTTGAVVGSLAVGQNGGGAWFSVCVLNTGGAGVLVICSDGTQPVTTQINPADSFTITAAYDPSVRDGGWTGSTSQPMALVFSH